MKKNNAYDIDTDTIELSKNVTDKRDLLKYKLAAEIIKIMRKLTIEEIQAKTDLNRADLSRIKTQTLDRFTIDRLIKILHLLGQSVNITVKLKYEAS